MRRVGDQHDLADEHNDHLFRNEMVLVSYQEPSCVNI